MYYSLNIPKDNITLPFCYESVELIGDIILPMTQDLTANPNSGTILIDDAENLKIITYLNKTKNLYNDNSQKIKIDFIINEINFLTNKTNNEITNYLSNN
ncbi:hypothetical protein [Flavobacterium sp. AG291]|uniref:hypothetical protein n=1 Tax=Flavobacterium sp. AG291 TaxID=2184000 RepID=UPI000E0AE8CE|nr:hypothetical protein [Flavobacterium sp. AG291]RDI12137.1 hypothetical protein DEU42_10469 [Flavobacterium sp. AG291]